MYTIQVPIFKKKKSTFNLDQSWKFIFLDCCVIQFKKAIIHSFAA